MLITLCHIGLYTENKFATIKIALVKLMNISKIWLGFLFLQWHLLPMSHNITIHVLKRKNSKDWKSKRVTDILQQTFFSFFQSFHANTFITFRICVFWLCLLFLQGKQVEKFQGSIRRDSPEKWRSPKSIFQALFAFLLWTISNQ